MSLVRVQNFSISLDGFGTGEGLSADAYFGHAGDRLHEWMFATRWWRDPHEGVILRVIPMHARRQMRAAVGHRDVELEREPAARGPRGAEQPRRALAERSSL